MEGFLIVVFNCFLYCLSMFNCDLLCFMEYYGPCVYKQPCCAGFLVYFVSLVLLGIQHYTSYNMHNVVLLFLFLYFHDIHIHSSPSKLVQMTGQDTCGTPTLTKIISFSLLKTIQNNTVA